MVERQKLEGTCWIHVHISLMAVSKKLANRVVCGKNLLERNKSERKNPHWVAGGALCVHSPSVENQMCLEWWTCPGPDPPGGSIALREALGLRVWALVPGRRTRGLCPLSLFLLSSFPSLLLLYSIPPTPIRAVAVDLATEFGFLVHVVSLSLLFSKPVFSWVSKEKHTHCHNSLLKDCEHCCVLHLSLIRVH